MENKLEYAITEEETRIADRSVVLAVEAGASAVQVTLGPALILLSVATRQAENSFVLFFFKKKINSSCITFVED